jgi:molybdopterin converting factor small subunit
MAGGEYMKITVKLFATFREGRQKIQIMDLIEGTTVKEIIKNLKIDSSEIAILLVNGRDGTLNTPLQEGDVMALFPPVGGG